MFIVNRIVFALNGIAILMLLLSYTAPFVSPEIYWPIAFLGLGYPLLVIANLLFIVYWVGVFKLKFLYSLVAILLGYTFIPDYVQLAAKKNTEKDNAIVLMNFNMKNFGGFDGKPIKEPDKFFNTFDKIAPNLICFQEYKELGTKIDMPMYDRLYKKLTKLNSCNTYPAKHGKRDFNADRMVIFSTFPIIHSGKVEQQEGSDNFTIFADIIAYGDTIRVINTHLQSIKFNAPDYKAMTDLSLTNDSTVSQYSTISKKLKIAFIMRAKQASAIREFIDQSPYKVIVCGDFNDSPTSFAYRTVKGKMKDAFIESGSGFGRTYVGTMPSFRIDYMLHDPSFTAYNYYAKAFEFSDHKMISCTIKMK